MIINLIAASSTSTSLKIYTQLHDRHYEKAVEVTDQQLAAVNINRHAFQGERNYTVVPTETKS